MDIKLLFTVNTLILLLTSTFLLTYHIKDMQNKSIKFLTYFILLHFFGFVFFILRNKIPDFISIVVANMLFALGVIFFYMSIRSIAQKEKIWYYRYLIPLFIYFLGFILFTYISYDTKTRILIYYSFCAVFLFPAGWILWTAGSQKFQYFDKISAVLFFIISMIFTWIVFQAATIRIETYYFSNKNIFMIISIIIIDITSIWSLLALKYRLRSS